MKPRVTVITLGVDDLDRAVQFYRDGLGWMTEGIVGREIEHGAVAFFDLDGGTRLALWPRRSLAADTALKIKYTGFELPPARKAGIKVKTVAELVEKLKSEAKVL